MKSYGFLLFFFIIGTTTSISFPDLGICTGSWNFFDAINTKVAVDWQIISPSYTFLAQFRPSLLTQGFWYSFTLRLSSQKPVFEIVYGLRWPTNQSQLFWNIYNVTQTEVTIVDAFQSLISGFQNWITSGLVIVKPQLNVDDILSILSGDQCLYLVYMRGHFDGDQPLPPDEVFFNRSLCITCPAFQKTSTTTPVNIANTSTTAQLTSTLTVSNSSSSIFNTTSGPSTIPSNTTSGPEMNTSTIASNTTSGSLTNTSTVVSNTTSGPQTNNSTITGSTSTVASNITSGFLTSTSTITGSTYTVTSNTTSTSVTSVPTTTTAATREIDIEWSGYIINKNCTDDCGNLTSNFSKSLAENLEKVFCSLPTHYSSTRFNCKIFTLRSLKSGSIIFASDINISTNESEDSTLSGIQNAMKTLTESSDGSLQLQFDATRHNVTKVVQQTTTTNTTPTSEDDSWRVIVGCVVGIGGFLILLITVLCIYVFRKNRRQESSLFNTKTSRSHKYHRDSYTNLADLPLPSSSSPYLIQSTRL